MGNTVELLTKLETVIGFKLPTEYREYVAQNARPRIAATGRRVSGVERLAVIDCLFQLGVSRDFDLIVWNSEYASEIDGRGVVIGGDPFGNLFLLSAGDMVYYWDHIRILETSSEKRNAYIVAEHFIDFLRGSGGVKAIETGNIVGPMGTKLPENVWHSTAQGKLQEINRATFVEFAHQEGFAL